MTPTLPLRFLAPIFMLGVAPLAAAPDAAVSPAAGASLPLPDIVYPADSGVIDIKEKYGAKGDGKTDDTAAIQKAIDEHKRQGHFLFFPAGTYLVSKKLTYGSDRETAKYLTLQGAGRDKTIIKLQDNAPDFQDPSKPLPVITTYDGPITGMAFSNSVYDLSVDVGKGNPGAVGFEWTTNNQGTFQNVRIFSSDPAGAGLRGLDLTRPEAGPGLIKNVEVDGFDYGIAATNIFSMVLEFVTIKGQHKAGIIDNSMPLSIRKLRSENSVPAIQTTSPGCLIVLVESDLVGGGGQNPAILNQGKLVLRDVTAEGYEKMVDNSPAHQKDLSDLKVTEYFSQLPKKYSAFPDAPAQSLRLPIRETPPQVWDPVDKWQAVDASKLTGDGDCSPVIQAAIDEAAKTGKTTVFIPGGCSGRLHPHQTIHIHGSVRRFAGLGNAFDVTDDFATTGKTLFMLENLDGDSVEFDNLWVINWNFAKNNMTVFQETEPKTLVLRALGPFGVLYKGVPGATLFIEDVAPRGLVLDGEKVWARQLNPEGDLLVSAKNSDLWVLGLKTESRGATILSMEKGRAEVLGGFDYPTAGATPLGQPAFEAINAQLSVSTADTTFNGPKYKTYLTETRGNDKKDVPLGDASCGDRGDGGSFPLLVAFPPGSVLNSHAAGSSPNAKSDDPTAGLKLDDSH